MAMENETIILRFRDLVTADNETIAKHTAVIDEHGYVWWAWWKKGNEKTPEAQFASLAIKAKSAPLRIFLVDSGQGISYCATCVEVQLLSDKKMPSPEKEKTPEYYRDQEYYAWFKFTKIEACEKTALTEFSYVDCKDLFIDSNIDYSRFDNKRIYSITELIQQNRTVWFIRKAMADDLDNEIVLLNSDLVQPTNFSTRYYQATSDTILWLSDLHLSDYVFKNERGQINKSLTKHIKDCVGERNVAALLVSGDITSRAEQEGFDEAQRLLQNINYEISASLNSENILICPGNHDFVRETANLTHGSVPAFIYNKAENSNGFSTFYHSIFKINPNRFFASGKKILLSSGHIIELAALNSMMLQQYPNFEGHGYLTQEQLDFVAEEMGWNDSNNQKSIRVVMMHHHYLPACYTEVVDATKASSAVYDADRLMNWLVKNNVKILLHGHKHKSFVAQISYPRKPAGNISVLDQHRISIVGMGGTGARGTDNKFATIRFDNDEVIFEFYRIYSDESAEDGICQEVRFRV